MTIEKGQSWGEAIAADAVFPSARGDREVATMAAAALAAGEQLTVRLSGGDLAATLGLAAEADERAGNDERLAFPIDLAMARLDGGSPQPFVAHLTVRRRPDVAAVLGHGPGVEVAVMNAAWLGPLRLGPRAHPNDGLVDVTEGRVPFRHRREAARRARSGSHLPHPDLTHRRVKTWERSFSKPVSVWLDDVSVGRFRTLQVEVVPDALRVFG